MTEKSILKVFPPPKNLNTTLKTLNKKLGKEKIKTYLCSRYKSKNGNNDHSFSHRKGIGIPTVAHYKHH